MARISLGRYVVPGTPATLPLAVESADLWSAHVVGVPGFGKSTFLANLALQCAAAGEGVIVLDVKGDLVESILARTEYWDRVVWVEPHTAAARGHYWSLNP